MFNKASTGGSAPSEASTAGAFLMSISRRPPGQYERGERSSQQTYYAYGLPRTTKGTLPTDYAFTRQRQDGYIKWNTLKRGIEELGVPGVIDTTPDETQTFEEYHRWKEEQ